jgi:hypothetical protein
VVETAVVGNVEAQLSYNFKAPYSFTHALVTIKRDGAPLVSETLSPLTRYAEVVPARYFDHEKSVAIRDLDGDSEPEIVLDLYSGGAHCCWYTIAYRYSPATGAYLGTRHVWGNTTYRVTDPDRDGRPEFISGDDRFAYVFAAFAYSSSPVQIRRYRAGRFGDVTREFPGLIRRDAHRQWRSALAKPFRRHNAGLLAAWAADQCLLRHCASAFKQLAVLKRQGRIGLGWDPTPRRYLAHLRLFLRRTGYVR